MIKASKIYSTPNKIMKNYIIRLNLHKSLKTKTTPFSNALKILKKPRANDRSEIYYCKTLVCRLCR